MKHLVEMGRYRFLVCSQVVREVTGKLAISSSVPARVIAAEPEDATLHRLPMKSNGLPFVNVRTGDRAVGKRSTICSSLSPHFS